MLKNEMINVKDENLMLKELNKEGNTQKDYEISRLKEANDRLSKQVITIEQESRILRKDLNHVKLSMATHAQEIEQRDLMIEQFEKENVWLRDKITKLQEKYNDDSWPITVSAQKQRATIYSSLKSKEYSFKDQQLN